jgi:hypothetical protein
MLDGDSVDKLPLTTTSLMIATRTKRTFSKLSPKAAFVIAIPLSDLQVIYGMQPLLLLDDEL